MRSPDDVEAAQARALRDEASGLVAEVVRQVEAQGPLRRGRDYSVRVEGGWSAAALLRAEDALGEAGWLRVTLRPHEQDSAVLGLLTCPEEG
jgi:hypothetical protein